MRSRRQPVPLQDFVAKRVAQRTTMLLGVPAGGAEIVPIEPN
jgi:hypothetical protein